MTHNESPAPVQYQAGPVELTLPGLTVVAVKVLGLYALLQAIPHVMYIPGFLMGGGGTGWAEGMFYALPGAIYLAAGVIFLFASDWIVTRVMGVSRSGIPPTAVDEHFHAMAFSVVGVVLIVSGLADTASIIGNHAAEESMRQSGIVVEAWSIAPLAEPAVELVAGLLLFLRGRGLASLWHRMRHPTLQHHGADSE